VASLIFQQLFPLGKKLLDRKFSKLLAGLQGNLNGATTSRFLVRNFSEQWVAIAVHWNFIALQLQPTACPQFVSVFIVMS